MLAATQIPGGNGRRFLSQRPSDEPTLPIKTLDPRKMRLVRQPLSNLSGGTGVFFFISSQRGREKWVVINYYSIGGPRKTFPPGTVGVLYYHRPPVDRSPVSGGLRFRLLFNVSKFDEGEDLKGRDGQVWQQHLYNISNANKWAGIQTKLVMESLVDEEVTDDLNRLGGFRPGKYNYHYDLDEPFFMDMEKSTISRTFISRSAKHHFFLSLKPPVYTTSYEVSGRTPYLGCILVRFELYHPPSTPGIKQNLVLRVLDILIPFQSLPAEGDSLVPPVPGELAMLKRHSGAAIPATFALANRREGKFIVELAGIPWS